MQALKILHCLRAPVGGLFRHVLDLAIAQSDAGHDVGIVCAASGEPLCEERLARVAPRLRLGIHRLPMLRDIGFGDLMAWRRVVNLVRQTDARVIHGHGAKGGAYARLAARTLKGRRAAVRCYYTPHGGSLHYGPETVAGRIYRTLERRFETWTDGILFESRFAADRYATQFGSPACATQVVTNGLQDDEFDPVVPSVTACDFVFVGELRMLKGVDVALNALASVNRQRPATAFVVGAGPDAVEFKALAQSLGLGDRVVFPGALPARQAFAQGRVLLMPSRAESLPYVVLEAVAAGLPVIATNVGGIPEIIAPPFGPLLPPGDAEALAQAMLAALDQPGSLQHAAAVLRDSIRSKFTVTAMAAAITDFYTAPVSVKKAA